MGESTKKQTEVINQQIKDLVGIYRTVVGRLGMSENEFWIWYALIVMGGSYTQQDICLMWSLSKQTVNTIISNMVRKGYASLEAIPGTRNRKEIHLTETGKAYGESSVLPIFDAEQRAMEKLSYDERRVCSLTFGRYIGLLKEEMNASPSESGR